MEGAFIDMIVVSVGTQDFQFNRLLQEVDRLIEKGIIQEEVFAQIGYSKYEPKHFQAEAFTDFERFDCLLAQCSFLITHGGAGTLIGALKMGKKIIAVPRLRKYDEHVDDHQTEIIQLFAARQLLIGLHDVDELEQAVLRIGETKFNAFVSGNHRIIQMIDDFIHRSL